MKPLDPYFQGWIQILTPLICGGSGFMIFWLILQTVKVANDRKTKKMLEAVLEFHLIELQSIRKALDRIAKKGLKDDR